MSGLENILAGGTKGTHGAFASSRSSPSKSSLYRHACSNYVFKAAQVVLQLANRGGHFIVLHSQWDDDFQWILAK